MSSAVAALSPGALLSGVRVLELSHSVAGAYCGKILSDLGADVTRKGPLLTASVHSEVRAVVAEHMHRGKLQLTDADDAKFAGLLDTMDVLIAERGSADREHDKFVDRVASAPTFEHAVVVEIASAFDREGPLPATGLTASAAAGMSWVIGSPDREPLTLPFDIPDHQVAAHAASAALVGLLRPAVGGSRGRTSIATRDVLAYYVGMLVANYLPYERPWQREGTRPPMSGGVYPCGLFECSDGWVALYCRSSSEWAGLLEAMGHPAWAADPRFADPRAVARFYADEVDAHLLPWVKSRTRADLMDLGKSCGIPIAAVRSIAEMLEDPHFVFREALPDLQLSTSRGLRKLQTPAMPWRISSRSDEGERTVNHQRHTASAPAHEDESEEAPLAGVRVLDLSWVWSGPMVTSMLSDLGAEVLKVENPERLDSVRTRGRARRGGVELPGPEHEVTPWFNQLNHGKRSIEANIKTSQGKQIIETLVRSCDILVENMRPGALADAGLGYSHLSDINPGLVMLSMSMAGQTGPSAAMKGYAGTMSAMAGIESLVGYSDRDITGMTATAFGDPNGASHGLAVLLGALYRQRRTGAGSWIDLSQMEALLSIMAEPVLQLQICGELPVPGNRHPTFVPHGHFPCKGTDQWVAIAVTTDSHWRAICDLAGGGLQSHMRDLDAASRLENRSEIEAAVAAWTQGEAGNVLAERLTRAGVPAADLASFEKMTQATWKSERALSQSMDHPYLGEQDVFVLPWQGVGPFMCGKGAPLLGADTAEVLAGLTSTEAESRTAHGRTDENA